MRILVMGTGSMGSIIGALMTKSGWDVTLCDKNEAHVRAMNAYGLKIEGYLNETIGVKAVLPSELKGIFDLVIFLTKATANESALTTLKPHLSEDGCVITLQNGINEDVVASFVGRERTCGGIILWGATLKAPGISELTSTPEQMGMVIGELDGACTARISKIKEVLSAVGSIEVTDKLMSHKWSKLCINAGFSGVGTVIDGDYGKVVDNDKAVRTAVFVIKETVLTAEALGHTQVKYLFMEPQFFVFQDEEQLNKVINFFRVALEAHRNIYPSMLQDIKKGLKCEVDVINGYVKKRAKEVNIPTPVNDQVTRLIREIESKRRKPSLTNLEEIVEPIEAFRS